MTGKKRYRPTQINSSRSSLSSASNQILVPETPLIQQPSNSSIVNIKQNAVESLIKTVIQGSDILEESRAQKINSELSTASTCSTSRPRASNEGADTDSNKTEVNSLEIVRPTKTNGSNKNTNGTDKTYLLLQQMKNDSVSKISQIIMSNDTFKQIICDAVTLEVKEKITELEKKFNILKLRLKP